MLVGFPISDWPLRGDAEIIILVGEDDEVVSRVSAAALRKLNYTVLHAAGRHEVLIIIRDQRRN